jgi:hypothetical protein
VIDGELKVQTIPFALLAFAPTLAYHRIAPTVTARVVPPGRMIFNMNPGKE